MNTSDIRFFEIEYNYKEQPMEQNSIAIVTNAEYNTEVFSDEVDEQIYYYGLDTDSLKQLVEQGHSSKEDFVVFDFKPCNSLLA